MDAQDCDKSDLRSLTFLVALALDLAGGSDILAIFKTDI